MDIEHINRIAWDRRVAAGNRWTLPVSSEEIAAARCGDFQLLLTPNRSVPQNWYPELEGQTVLCLASAGGQQAPILAAAGAKVTVVDNSPMQLAQDEMVASREGLDLERIQRSMTDLLCFEENAFGLIFHPCSNCYVPDVNVVWHECSRVLKPGGVLLSGFVNPVRYLLNGDGEDAEELRVRFKIPYSDMKDLSSDRLQLMMDSGEAFEFGHSLEDLIGGQVKAGFAIDGFYEDSHAKRNRDPLSRYMASFIATRAVKRGSES